MNEERHINSFSRGIWYAIIPIVIFGIIYMAFRDQSTIAYRSNGVTLRYIHDVTLEAKNSTKENIKISVYCDGHFSDFIVLAKDSREIHLYYGTNVIEVYQNNKSSNFEIKVKNN